MMTAAQVRAKYPTPVRSRTIYPQITGYCVGGALFLAFYDPQYQPASVFPGATQIRDLLMRANPDVSFLMAELAANDIIMFNDAGSFEAAWRVLDQVLSYRRHVETVIESEVTHEGELVPA